MCNYVSFVIFAPGVFSYRIFLGGAKVVFFRNCSLNGSEESTYAGCGKHVLSIVLVLSVREQSYSRKSNQLETPRFRHVWA